MVFTNNTNTELNHYYGTTDPTKIHQPGIHPAPIPPCDKPIKLKWLSSPYDTQETIYWFMKMLVLPGLVSAFIIIYYILPTLENPIFAYINSILTYVASVFIFCMARESTRAIINRIPHDQLEIPNPLNSLDNVLYKIGFVGDIMMMREHDLKFDPAVKTFFNDVDVIIGNLEGILTDSNNEFTKQRHKTNIIPDLEKLLSPTNSWLLCLSNNHSIDFGTQPFHHSLIDIQKNDRFDVFGRNDVPNVLVENLPINIVTGTEWSNQKTWNCTSRYRNQELWTYYSNVKVKINNVDVNRFNILFPHWGYENERYVRKRIQKDAKALLTFEDQEYTRTQNYIREHFDKLILPDKPRKWDLIFGHHSHVRQPIMRIDDYLTDQMGVRIKDARGNDVELKKLVAFSGGNFTSGVTFFRRKKHIYGYIMKCNIGSLKGHATQLAVGNVEVKYTVNCKDRSAAKKTKVVKIDDGTYNKLLHYLCSLLIGFGIIALIMFLRYIDSIL